MPRLVNPSNGITGTNFVGQVQLAASLYQKPITPTLNELKKKFIKNLDKSQLSKLGIVEYTVYEEVWGSISEDLKDLLYNVMGDEGIWLATKAPRDPEFYYDYRKVKEFNLTRKTREQEAKNRRIESLRKLVAENVEEWQQLAKRISYLRKVQEAREKAEVTLRNGSQSEREEFWQRKAYNLDPGNVKSAIDLIRYKQLQISQQNERIRDILRHLTGEAKQKRSGRLPGDKSKKKVRFTWKTAWAMVKEIVKPPKKIMPAIVNNFYNYKMNPHLVDFHAYGELSANLGEPTREWKRRYDHLLTMEFTSFRKTPNNNKVGGIPVGPGVAGKNFNSIDFKGYQTYIYFGHDRNSKVYADSAEARTKFISKRASYVLRRVRNAVISQAKSELTYSKVGKAVGNTAYYKPRPLTDFWK